MNAKIQELVNRGIINMGTPKQKAESIEIFVEGDINDADYVRDTYSFKVDAFMKNIEMWAKAVDYSGYIDDCEDKNLKNFLRDISPSSPSDGCDVHTIEEIRFTYHDGQGNSLPFTLRTPQDVRDFKVDSILNK